MRAYIFFGVGLLTLLFLFVGHAFASGAGGFGGTQQQLPLLDPPETCPARGQTNICCNVDLHIQNGAIVKVYSASATYTQCENVKRGMGINSKSSFDQTKATCVTSQAAGEGSLYSVAGRYMYTDPFGQVRGGNRCDGEPVMSELVTEPPPTVPTNTLLGQTIVNQPTASDATTPTPPASSDQTTPLSRITDQNDWSQTPTAPARTYQSPPLNDYFTQMNTLTSQGGMTPDEAASQLDNLANGTPAQQKAAYDLISQKLIDGGFAQSDIGQIIGDSPAQGGITNSTMANLNNPDNSVSAPTQADTNINGINNTQVDQSGNPSTSQQPFGQQNASDQVNSIAASECTTRGIQNCAQFQNSMNGVFNHECSGIPNCSNPSYTAQGSFQEIPANYNAGMKAYLATADPTSDAYQAVQSTCVNGNADIAVHICNTAAAAGNLSSVQNLIQSAYPDQQHQLAATLLYHTAPGQFLNGDVTNIQTYPLSDASRSALCSNGVCLPAGATGGDAVNALANSSGIQRALSTPSSGLAGTSIVPGPANYTSAGPQNTTAAIGSSPSLLGANYSSPMSLMAAMLMNPFSSLTRSLTIAVTPQQTTSPPPPQPTFSLSVQPPSVQPGQSISVSWTSSNMSGSNPCTITQNGATIASANVGSTLVPTTASSTPGTLVFQLLCQGASNGQVYQQSASAVIQ